jgi:spore cortex biosynthesis protein YabQ
MSQDIVQEITFFLHSILVGLVITFIYDWILILRKLVKHGIVLVSIEDFIFWFACGIGVFYMLYRENNGVLRWFAVAGAALGMLLYKIVIKDRFIYIMSTCIHKMMWFVFRLIQIVLKPLKCAFSAINRFLKFIFKKIKKCIQKVKKRLTVCIKMLKIVLCKR